jgi:hypothetical protein
VSKNVEFVEPDPADVLWIHHDYFGNRTICTKHELIINAPPKEVCLDDVSIEPFVRPGRLV